MNKKIKRLLIGTGVVIVIISFIVYYFFCDKNGLGSNLKDNTTTVSYLLANQEEYFDEFVMVHATVADPKKYNFIGCTEKACLGENKCCNSCTTDIKIVDPKTSELLSLISRDKTDVWRCSGNECDENLTCSNFEVGATYTFEGYLRTDPNWEGGNKKVVFEVYSYQRDDVRVDIPSTEEVFEESSQKTKEECNCWDSIDEVCLSSSSCE